jgi:hypothetical protein
VSVQENPVQGRQKRQRKSYNSLLQ